jgi:PAS domain S-box-containing protein
MAWTPTRSLSLALGLAAVYFAAAKIGLSLAFETDQVTAVWPPTGIALAAVALYGPSVWPGIALGAFLANVTAAEPVATALGIAAGNTLEALCGVALVSRFVRPREALSSLRGALAWIGFAVLLAPVVAATVGVTSLCLGGVHTWRSFPSLGSLWWVGDAAGAVLVGPLLLAWATGRPWTMARLRWLEASALLAFATGLSAAIFFAPAGLGTRLEGLVFLLIAFVVWGSLRFGSRGMTAVVALSSGLAILGTARGHGPFALGTPLDSLVVLQSFLAVVGITGLVLVGADADRRRVQAALRDSERRYSALAEAVPGPLFTLTSDGACDYLSRAFYEHTGRQPGGSPTEDWLASIHPEDAPRMRDAWRAAAHDATELDVELRLRGRDGQWSWYSCRAQPVRDTRGRPVKWYGTCASIESQKQVERALQEAGRRKDEFLALLGHELRHPLAPIRYAAALLGARSDAGPEERRAIEIIERQVNHAVRLVDDLLDAARIAQNRLRLVRETDDLREIVRTTVQDHAGSFADGDLHLQLELPGDRVPVFGDRTRLAQVVANLLQNACRFTDAGGTVTVTLQARGDWAELTVRDTGQGMDVATQQQLFQARAATDLGLTRSRGGLGLGLILVRALVELHGGEVSGTSTGPGSGSVFTVRLPLQPTAAASSGQVEPAGAPRRPLRVLVIEDDPDTAYMLRLLLESSGHVVEQASGGEQGLEAARTRAPDVVLCDLTLPGLDGCAVARALRAAPATRAALLVAVTGHGLEEDRHRTLEAGFDVHLVKPVDFARLQQVLSAKGDGAPHA